MTALSCSDGSFAAGEQLAGSAPHAASWVALEQNGPWGAKAFTSSHLDPDLGRYVEAAAAPHGVRPSLIRRPGRHPDAQAGSGDVRHLLVAHTRPGRSWLLQGRIGSPEALRTLDWAAVGAGDLDAVRRSLPVLEPSARPQLLVCTNARRDVCCAVKGRPLALGVAALRPGQVWEVTHTSGHRFAPTTVLLPAGTMHGRLDVGTADGLLSAAERGETVLEGARGRSTWPGPAQAAELAVREATGEIGLDALDVVAHEPEADRRWTTTLCHVDGRRWTVVTTAVDTDVERAESCGKALVPMTYLTHVVEHSP